MILNHSKTIRRFIYIPTVHFRYGILSTVSHSTIVLYIRDHEELGFPSQRIHQKTSFTNPSWHLGSIG